MEGKKSFVLYTDLIHTVKKLPKDKQADLFVMILEYVNDMNPTTEDLLLDVAFEPIKRQLKRDLIKYEERAKRSRDNGSKGGRPPKEEDSNKPKKPSGLSGNPDEPRKPDSVTVNDTVSVNDTDTVTDKIIKTHTTENAFQIFDHSGLNGRFFSTVKSIHYLDETVLMSEFEKWKLYHNGNDFKDEKAMRNSFSMWMNNYKPEKKKNGHALQSHSEDYWKDL